jgi:hypothetical protein
MRMATLLAARTKQAAYSGAAVQDARVQISAEEFAAATSTQARTAAQVRTAAAAADGERHRLLQKFATIENEYRAAKIKAVKIARAVKDGVKGSKLRKLVASTLSDRERKLVSKDIDPFLVRGGFYEKKQKGPRQYQGAVLKEAAAQRVPDILPPQEVRKAIRWARQQLSEGFSGDQLDTLMQHRFSPPLVKAASEQLVQIRSKHEGLAGYVYVDSQAYASKKGSAGCDKGALKHRANGLKFVLAMDRCGPCVFKNADGVCQKYNKVLVDEIAGPEMEAIRQANLRSGNMTDQEATASLFGPTNMMSQIEDPVSEFQLHNGSMDNVDLDDLKNSAEIAQLQHIFFGGFEV